MWLIGEGGGWKDKSLPDRVERWCSFFRVVKGSGNRDTKEVFLISLETFHSRFPPLFKIISISDSMLLHPLSSNKIMMTSYSSKTKILYSFNSNRRVQTSFFSMPGSAWSLFFTHVKSSKWHHKTISKKKGSCQTPTEQSHIKEKIQAHSNWNYRFKLTLQLKSWQKTDSWNLGQI